MATNTKFPGVYPSITDLTGVVATNAVTACGFVGEAEYGPVFTPTLLSSLSDYTSRFGTLSSKFGYAGYSLAVAAETIGQHYFVRVVPTGEAGSHVDDKDACWASTPILASGKSSGTVGKDGYWYEEIKAAELSRDSGADSGLFGADKNTAIIVAAKDPNNRKFYVSVEDSTINENQASGLMAAPTVAGKVVTVVLDASRFEMKQESAVGDKIVVTRFATITEDDEEIDPLNGTFKIKSRTYDAETGYLTLTYDMDAAHTITFTADMWENARIKLYPPANETTFSFTVMEKIGRVMQTLETYEYCTLYPAQDEYGNSMFLEDVINGTSNYIQVFTNKALIEENEDEIITPTFTGTDPLLLDNGQSGTWASQDVKYTALNEAWELFRDRSQVEVSLLMNSGYVQKNNVSYQSKMLEIAEARRDCFCLFDTPMTETSLENAIDWRSNVQGFNTYRGAVYAPWVKTYDSVQGRANFVMCPSAYAAKVMGAYNPWVAPAGLNRGVISASAVSPTGLTQYYDTVQGGKLYADNQINCLIKNPGAGYVVWGQRTLQAKPSALDRINVARTVIYIETILRDAAKWHLFENNTAYLRMQITLQFNAFLDTILSAEGVDGYKVVCDTTNNTSQVIQNNQLVIDIYLMPVYTAEVIRLNTVITNDLSTTVVTTI